MSRSRYKFFFLSHSGWKGLLRSVRFKRWLKFRYHYMFSKSSMIPEVLDNQLIRLHKGHQFKKLTITSDMVGHRFGLFIVTRKPFYFPIKVKKKKKKIILWDNQVYQF